MATKDWKRVKNNKFQIHFERKKDKALLEIDNVEGFEFKHQNGKWLLEVDNDGIEKGFRTKVNALKFARAYMRIH